jgi:hypothetical protein
VFTAGRRENVVVADTLVFPNHQVSYSVSSVAGGFLVVLWLIRDEGGGDGHAQEVMSTNSCLTCSIGGCYGYAQAACELVETVDRHDVYICTRKKCQAAKALMNKCWVLPSTNRIAFSDYRAYISTMPVSLHRVY